MVEKLFTRIGAALSTALRRFAPLAGALVIAPACTGSKDAPALSRAEPTDEPIPNVPSPPENGPKLYVLKHNTPVMDRPSANGKKLGELAAGAVLARSNEPYSKKRCDLGWYVVRPKGFVCAGEAATIDMVTAVGTPAQPDLSRALPYRYAKIKAENVPVYARLPTPGEQMANEPDLMKVIGKGEDKEALGLAANDVPLDARGVPTGPPVLAANGEGVEGNKRSALSFFGFSAEAAPPFIGWANQEPKAGALRRGSGLAITGTFKSEAGAAPRRFGITPDGRIIPTDRLKPALGTTFHGLDLDKVGLPLAFVHKQGVHTYSMVQGKANKNDDEVDKRAAVPLTGKFRTVDGVRFEETRDGEWLRAQDLVVIVKRHKFPDFAKGSQRWLDVSVANQTLTMYEGNKPLYATLISTGKDMLKDPQASAATPRGAFRVKAKYVSHPIDPKEVSGGVEVGDVPWILETDGGFSFMATYWGDGLGEAQTFHNIALSPIDARRIWTWSEPEIPEGWAGAELPEGGTMVLVRP